MEIGQVSYYRYTQNQGSHDFKDTSLRLGAEPSSSKVHGLWFDAPHWQKEKRGAGHNGTHPLHSGR